MAETKWQFPLIDPNTFHDIKHYLDHIKEEMDEFERETDPEKKDMEAVDVLHAAETFVRKYFERETERPFERIRAAIIAKNATKGYY